MAEVGTGAAGSAIVEIGKCGWQAIKPHIGYLFCYRKKVEELKRRVSGMAQTRNTVQLHVETADRRGDTVHGLAQEWLADFQRLQGGSDEMGNEVEGVRRFCWGFCWDLGAGYRLGKRASQEMATVAGLQTRANNLVPPGVSTPPPPPSIDSLLPNDGFQAFQTTTLCMESVLEELRRESASLIAVHGMGGVGKTSLIKEVTKKAKSDGLFNEAVFAVVSRDVNIKMIQQQIAEGLGIDLREETELVRASKIREKLMNKRILVVLDDLWKSLELSQIGIPTKQEGSSTDTSTGNVCRVVITTRFADLGCRMLRQAVNIPMSVLSDEEAWELFTKTVGDLNAGVQQLAKDAAKECGGMPLALTVLGKAMRGKHDMEKWREVLEDLRKSRTISIPGMKEEVYNVIKYSFDHIDDEETKLCFLFCCLLPEDFSVPVGYIHPLKSIYAINLSIFTSYAVGDGFLVNETDTLVMAERHVRKLLLKLKDYGLLLEGDAEGSVKMHDVVRDVAIQIASSKDIYGFCSRAGTDLLRWPAIPNLDTRQRISLMNTKIDHLSLPDEVVCPNLRTLILRNISSFSDGFSLPDGFFKAMKVLGALDLRRPYLPSIPASLSSLTNLRVLYLEIKITPSFDGLSSIVCLKKLEILSISTTRTVPFHDFYLPKEIGDLTSLRCLDLTGCEGIRIPGGVISRLSRLEQLCLLDGFKGWQVQGGGDLDLASFTELARLSHLTRLYVDVENIECLSHDFSPEPWRNLIEFHIRTGSQLYFPMNNYESTLHLTGTIAINSWLKELMTRTKELCLFNWKGIKCLVSDDESDIPPITFSVVETLYIDSMIDMIKLCDKADPAGSSFAKLRYLTVKDCKKLIIIFPSDLLLRAGRLEELEVESCDVLQKVFHYQGMPGDQAPLLPELKRLHLSYLPQLTSIWEGDAPPEGSLQGVEYLTIKNCDRLKCVVSPALAHAHAYKRLKGLTINTCEQLERIIVWEDTVRDQVSFFKTHEAFSCLQSLDISECHRLTSIFSWREARGLQQLYLKDCDMLKCVITSIEVGDVALMAVMDDKVSLPQLKRLFLKNLPVLSSFHQAITTSIYLPSLEDFSVCNCPQLAKLTLEPKSLKHISVSNSSEIIRFMSSDVLFRPQLLHELTIEGLDELQELFHFNSMLGGQDALLSVLKTIDLSCLLHLTYICDGDVPDGCLPNLEKLRISNCGDLRFVLSPALVRAHAFGQLQSLEIAGCNQLEQIVSDTDMVGNQASGMLSVLKWLAVADCGCLTSLFSWKLARGLQKLEYLTIRSCCALKELIVPEEPENQAMDDKSLLPKLRELTLSELPVLSNFIGGNHCTISLRSLRSIKINDCPELKKLPLGPGSTQLQSLEIAGCNQLEQIVSDTDMVGNQASGMLSVLQKLVVEDCGCLTSLFSWKVARGLQKLQWLTIRRCCALKELIVPEEPENQAMDDNSLLPELRKLTLSELPVLSSFIGGSHCTISLGSLRSIKIKDCPELRKLPLGPGSTVEKIRASEEWFQSLQWEDQSTKSRLREVFWPYSPSDDEESASGICSMS